MKRSSNPNSNSKSKKQKTKSTPDNSLDFYNQRILFISTETDQSNTNTYTQQFTEYVQKSKMKYNITKIIQNMNDLTHS